MPAYFHTQKPKTKIPIPSNPTTLLKIIPTRPRMRHQILKRTTPRKNHPIRARRPPRINLIAAQNRELVIRPRIREVEPLVVVLRVRVMIVADRLALFEVVAALGDGGVDVGLVVAG